MADTPIACTLGPESLGPRLAWIRRVTEQSLIDHELAGATLRLMYRTEAQHELEQIVAKERECCSFLTYSLERTASAVQLIIHTPPGTEANAKWLFDQFLPAVPDPTPQSCGCAPNACGRPRMKE